MSLMDSNLREKAEALADLATCNPFLPRRIELERRVLGRAFDERDAEWNVRPDLEHVHPNIIAMCDLGDQLVAQLQDRLAKGAKPTPAERDIYERIVLHRLYRHFQVPFDEATRSAEHDESKRTRLTFYDDFEREADRLLHVTGQALPARNELPHLFAIFFQIRRAFFHIYRHIVGSSAPTTRLRAAVWESIFTHDIQRYRRRLYQHMADITTLVTGPSGTGKELVARAIGLSRYIPFDPNSRGFTAPFAGSFHTLNLTSLSPTLIESELFGHKRGAFTGAVADRVGWLEVCPPLGTVFLDEIGDLDATIQVKLLRVLESRVFQRVGETDERTFRGKIITATNRDLVTQMESGSLRADFYYRLCSDMITTPSLRDRLVDRPEERRALVLFLAQRIAGDDAEELTDEVETWIDEHLGAEYPWSGNVRELEQCVRNVLIRQEYQPAQSVTATDPQRKLAEAIGLGTLTADELLRQYCTTVYAQTGSYLETSRRLALDRRTVKAKVDAQQLERIRAAEA